MNTGRVIKYVPEGGDPTILAPVEGNEGNERRRLLPRKATSIFLAAALGLAGGYYLGKLSAEPPSPVVAAFPNGSPDAGSSERQGLVDAPSVWHGDVVEASGYGDPQEQQEEQVPEFIFESFVPNGCEGEGYLCPFEVPIQPESCVVVTGAPLTVEYRDGGQKLDLSYRSATYGQGTVLIVRNETDEITNALLKGWPGSNTVISLGEGASSEDCRGVAQQQFDYIEGVSGCRDRCYDAEIFEVSNSD